MDLAFHKILKQDISTILPMIQKLMNNQLEDKVLGQRFSEMFDQNYECWGVHFEGKIIGVFGLWFMTRHYAGKSCEPDHVYIDDKYRGRGIGKEVFSWIYEYARNKGCETSELNSYVSNYPSHKFYLNEGYEIWAHHFVKKL
ncbi:GNAT family N-acetyltransferase [Aquimarina sp. MMG016]|uniref:GNAT family N-acetyltransferase n=1 Tax=Aquimarina sp. MMG016 TaxID=2822690 RepID=UPI001B3A314E|nr:GNAT family N-acetyltransferase [Aquimarina sp. MMG016]MBQ4822269.1 GNAT family N-acetyltransferase [Aquimarina sp. MMG016]